MLTEKDLLHIEKAKAKSQLGYNYLYKKYQKTVYFTIFNILKNDSITEDLVIVAFTKAFEKIDSYVENISFEMWLKTIANNIAIDYIRKMKKERFDQSIDEPDTYLQIVANVDDPEQKIIKSENIKQLENALDLLSFEHREIIRLRYYQNYTYEQLAEYFDKPTGTIKSILHKAKKNLANHFHKISQVT